MTILNIAPATREGSHVLVSLTGPSGSGKTYTALKVARGLVGPNGKVGFLDTEAGRGRLYAKVTPYHYAELTAPFSPGRFVASIDDFEQYGVDVLIIDSASHEWEGVGGVHDMAEGTKKQGLLKWAAAKAAHKRFVNRLLMTRMHVITCLRAREKFVQGTDPATGKEVILNSGFHEIQERNFIYEQTVSVLLLGGGRKVVTKCPEDLVPIFGEVGIETNGYLSEATGAQVAEWVAGGDPVDQGWEVIRRAAMEAAERGTDAYKRFFAGLPPVHRKRLTATDHENLKSVAANADELARIAEEGPPDEPGDEDEAAD